MPVSRRPHLSSAQSTGRPRHGTHGYGDPPGTRTNSDLSHRSPCFQSTRTKTEGEEKAKQLRSPKASSSGTSSETKKQQVEPVGPAISADDVTACNEDVALRKEDFVKSSTKKRLAHKPAVIPVKTDNDSLNRSAESSSKYSKSPSDISVKSSGKESDRRSSKSPSHTSLPKSPSHTSLSKSCSHSSVFSKSSSVSSKSTKPGCHSSKISPSGSSHTRTNGQTKNLVKAASHYKVGKSESEVQPRPAPSKSRPMPLPIGFEQLNRLAEQKHKEPVQLEAPVKPVKQETRLMTQEEKDRQARVRSKPYQEWLEFGKPNTSPEDFEKSVNKLLNSANVHSKPETGLPNNRPGMSNRAQVGISNKLKAVKHKLSSSNKQQSGMSEGKKHRLNNDQSSLPNSQHCVKPEQAKVSNTAGHPNDTCTTSSRSIKSKVNLKEKLQSGTKNAAGNSGASQSSRPLPDKGHEKQTIPRQKSYSVMHQPKIPIPADRRRNKVPIPADGRRNKVPIPADRRRNKVPIPADGRRNKVPIPADRRRNKVPIPADRRRNKVPIPADRRRNKVSIPEDRRHNKVPIPEDRRHNKVPIPEDRRHNKVPTPADRRRNKVPIPADTGCSKIAPSRERKEQGLSGLMNNSQQALPEQMQHLHLNDPDLPSYKMDRKPRGYCLIINNFKFYKIPDDSESRKMPDRSGTDVDAERLEKVFQDLDFVVRQTKNLTSEDMVKDCTTIALDKKNEDFDCFACCILTHGVKDHLYGTDGRLTPINDISSCFKALRCPGLRGKPKLFFIQACQGRDRQMGFPLEMDAPPVEDVETIPNEADFLMGYATVQGFVSYRSKVNGSVYIRILCDNLSKYGKRYDLLSIMTKVNDEVSRENAAMQDGQFKQIPAPTTTLRKKVYFR